MMLVNLPGSWQAVYPALLHANWHGFTVTDLVFPLFLFVIGSSLYFSLRQNQTIPKFHIALKIIKRGCLLFAIGLGLNSLWLLPPDSLEHLRIMGVMQRIGLVYICSALILLYLPKLHSTTYLVAVIFIILTCYYFLLAQYSATPFALETNLVQAIDLKILGQAHMYKMHGIAFEPEEGLLSSLPAIVSVLLRYLITQYLAHSQHALAAVKKLFLIGGILLLLGLLLDDWMPINKNLWSSSYVLYSAGWCGWLLAFFVYLLDVRKQSSLAFPLIVFGLNPLFIYILHWLLTLVYSKIPVANTNLYQSIYLWILQGDAPNQAASLLFAISQLFLLWGVCWLLYKRKIVIKL